jgi:hypothetical protein
MRGTFEFRTLDEAHRLAGMLSGYCQNPTCAGLGLIELMINAIEHGNLGISYLEKSELKRENRWEAEIAKRLNEPHWHSLKATIEFELIEGEVVFTITDQGEGFDWVPFMEFDPARAYDMNGRGIAMARTLGFKHIEYRGVGNCVVATTHANE